MMWHIIGVGDFSMHCAKNIFYSYLLNVSCFLITLSLIPYKPIGALPSKLKIFISIFVLDDVQ